MKILTILALISFIVLLVTDSTLIQFKSLGCVVLFLVYGNFRELEKISLKQNELYERLLNMEESIGKAQDNTIEVIEEVK